MIYKKILNNLKRFLFFLTLLYIFIPFETTDPTFSMKIRLAVAMGLTFYMLYLNDFKIKLNNLGKITLLLLIFLIILNSFISFDTTLFIFTGAIIFGAVTASIIKNNTTLYNDFLTGLEWLIIFSIFTLLFQLIYFSQTGEVISFHKMVYPLSEERIGIQKEFGNLHRLGGMYIEPGTYSNFMYLFLIIYLFLTKNIKSSLLFIGAVSILFTYSVWGIIFGSYFVIVLILARIKESSLKKKFTIIFLLFLINLVGINYILNSPAIQFAMAKMEAGGGSVSAKEDAYNKYAQTYDNFLIIGEGFSSSFEKGLTSAQDAGFLLNLSVILGIFFTALLILIYLISFIKSSDKFVILASLPIFISKIYYWDFAFWLLFFLIVYSGYAKNTTSNKNSSYINQG